MTEQEVHFTLSEEAIEACSRASHRVGLLLDRARIKDPPSERLLRYPSMDVVSRLLLGLEWKGDKCVECARPHKLGVHEPGCLMDEALATRGFGTQADRNAARFRIRYSVPPKESA